MEQLSGQSGTIQYSIDELILLAGASYQTITNAIDNGEVELPDEAQLQ